MCTLCVQQNTTTQHYNNNNNSSTEHTGPYKYTHAFIADFAFMLRPSICWNRANRMEKAMRMRCEPSREQDTIIKTIQNKHIYERRTRAPASLAMRLYKVFLLAPSAQHGRPFICLPARLSCRAHLSAFYVRVVVSSSSCIGALLVL